MNKMSQRFRDKKHGSNLTRLLSQLKANKMTLKLKLRKPKRRRVRKRRAKRMPRLKISLKKVKHL